MQEMIQIEAVVCGLPSGIVFRRRVDAGQLHLVPVRRWPTQILDFVLRCGGTARRGAVLQAEVRR